MLYTFIIVSILVVGLIAGMYFSSYQNINEKLALKKKYLRSENIFFKSPKIKSRISYSFGTIACLLLVFMMLNDPTVNLPFQRFTSAQMFNETIDELIMETKQKEYNFAIDLVSEVNQKPEQNKKVLDDEKSFFLVTNNSLISINKDSITNYSESTDEVNPEVYYYSNSLVKINGLIDYKNQLITYGDYTDPSSSIKESIIYLHHKDDLTLIKTIYVKGQIKYIQIQKGFLYCVTTNELHKNENYFGKITGIKFDEHEKYLVNEYKDIYYIPNNNIKHVLGFIKINLKKDKFDIETLLVSDYFLAINDSKVYISVNIDLDTSLGPDNGYIVQYDFNKMRIEKSNKIEGNIYNDFIFDDTGGFIVTTMTHKDSKHYYKVYMYDKNFYLKKTSDITSQDNEILIQDYGFYYLVDKGSKNIRFSDERCLPNNTFAIISDELSLDNIKAFNKIFHDKIILYSQEDEFINLKQYSILEDKIEQEIQLTIENKTLQKIVFDSYYYDGKVYNFINIKVLKDNYYTHYVIPYIENRMFPEYRFSFTSSLSTDKVSHFYINNYFVIFKEDSILIFSNEKVNSSIEIRLR